MVGFVVTNTIRPIERGVYVRVVALIMSSLDRSYLSLRAFKNKLLSRKIIPPMEANKSDEDGSFGGCLHCTCSLSS